MERNSTVTLDPASNISRQANRLLPRRAAARELNLTLERGN
jgi:hypothetical protein